MLGFLTKGKSTELAISDAQSSKLSYLPTRTHVVNISGFRFDITNRDGTLLSEEIGTDTRKPARHVMRNSCSFRYFSFLFLLLIAQDLVNSAPVWVPQRYQNQLRFQNEKLPEGNYTADCGVLNDVNA